MRSSRASSCLVTVALLLGLCAATSTTSATAVVEEPDPGLVPPATAERLLRADAADPVIVSPGPDGSAEFVGTLGSPVDAPAVPADATPVQAATEHLDRYGALFDVTRPRAQLDVTDVVDTAGGHIVKLGQQVDGLPVLGGELAVSVDADGDLQAVNGETTDPAVQAPAPVVAGAAAVRTAVAATARAHGVATTTLSAGTATEWFFDPELVGSPDSFGPRPVWRVEVSNGNDIRQLVLVDTATGAVVESVNQVMHALNRVVCNRNGVDENITRPCRRPAERVEGGPVSDSAAVNRAFDFAGHTSQLFGVLGRDLTRMIGYDAGDGARSLRLTVNLAGANAAWNGREAYFSSGFAVDDVVAHELTHGVIQHTSNLFYWYQSGAINESMADVFGEIVDQRNQAGSDAAADRWLVGEDSSFGALRDMRNPTRRLAGAPRQPDRMRSPLYAADTRVRDSGGVHINSGVGNKAAFLISQGGAFNGRQVRGIDPDPNNRTKTARIYFRALQMLTSGSDYADLGRVLPQACRGLVGRAGVTAGDCTQVQRAVAATEMLRQPVRASAPEAPRCPSRSVAGRRLFFDNMERPARRVWSLGRLWMRLPRPGLRVLGPYASSGRRSLFGLDADPSRGQPAQGSVTLRRSIRVPRSGRTFLRFDHARSFEHNFRSGRRARFFDGGRLEYSLNRGRTWSNAAGLRWVNGPHQRIIGPGPSAFRGFGGDSHGYMSSRLDLSRFAGRTVRLRWTVAADPAVGFVSSLEFYGWWIDDVDVYICRRR